MYWSGSWTYLIWGAYWRGIPSHSACVTSNWSAVFCPYKFVHQGWPALVYLNKQFVIVRLLEVLYKIGLGVDMNSIIGIYRDALRSLISQENPVHQDRSPSLAANTSPMRCIQKMPLFM